MAKAYVTAVKTFVCEAVYFHKYITSDFFTQKCPTVRKLFPPISYVIQLHFWAKTSSEDLYITSSKIGDDLYNLFKNQ